MCALITLLSLPLFVYGLGNTYLWQDEAQTALLARSVLQHGVPMVGAGPHSLSAHMGTDAGINGIYLQISWLQAYVAAASFQVFGESSWSARLPFALAGWLCVPLIAWVVRRAGGTRRAARWPRLLTATSVPFIVCSRQSRYYALTARAHVDRVRHIRRAHRSGQTLRRLDQAIGAATAFATRRTLLVLSFDITAIGILGVARAPLGVVAENHGGDRPFWTSWSVACSRAARMDRRQPLRADAPRRTPASPRMPNRFWIGMLYYAGQIDAYVVPFPLLHAGPRGRDWAAADARRYPACCHRDWRHQRRDAVAVRFFRYIVPVAAIHLCARSHWPGRAGRTRPVWQGSDRAVIVDCADRLERAAFAMSHSADARRLRERRA